MISCCAHVFDHVMTISVFVFTHHVLIICELIWSKLSWQFLWLWLLIMLWHFVKLSYQNFIIFFFLCLFIMLLQFVELYNQICNEDFCVNCVVWYACCISQYVLLCYLIILHNNLSFGLLWFSCIKQSRCTPVQNFAQSKKWLRQNNVFFIFPILW
jgi:hypothetical protein